MSDFESWLSGGALLCQNILGFSSRQIDFFNFLDNKTLFIPPIDSSRRDLQKIYGVKKNKFPAQNFALPRASRLIGLK